MIEVLKGQMLLLSSSSSTPPPFRVFSDTYSILRRMLGYTDDWQLHPEVSPHGTRRSSEAENFLGVSMFTSVVRCMPLLHNGRQVD